MTTVLALETATEACSVALQVGDTIYQRFAHAPRAHTELVLPMVAEILGEAEINIGEVALIAYGAGPGSFTGVRIASAVAQGLALPNETPVVGLSCLAILALGSARENNCTTVVPVMDARKDEIYSAVYEIDIDQGSARVSVPDWLGDAGSLRTPRSNDYVVSGTALEIYHDKIARLCQPPARLCATPRYPQAIDAIPLAIQAHAEGRATTPEKAQPIYLRRAL